MYDAGGLVCTGNFVNGTDLWGTPYGGGVADCGPSDRLTITVAPLAGPPAGQTWRFHYSAGGQPIAVRNVSSAGNALTYLFRDHLGSTSVAADPNGTITARHSYSRGPSTRS